VGILFRFVVLALFAQFRVFCAHAHFFVVSPHVVVIRFVLAHVRGHSLVGARLLPVFARGALEAALDRPAEPQVLQQVDGLEVGPRVFLRGHLEDLPVSLKLSFPLLLFIAQLSHDVLDAAHALVLAAI
jgi:hypothetical protein